MNFAKQLSFTQVAKDNNLSVSIVIRIFDLVSYPTPTLPETVSIDEFKGDTSTEKYQCIITDPVNKKVLDITEKRLSYFLTDYFSKFESLFQLAYHIDTRLFATRKLFFFQQNTCCIIYGDCDRNCTI